MPAWDFSDLTLPETTRGTARAPARLLALTILYHPDPSRVGDAATLEPSASAGGLSLSRREPGFAAPRGPATRRPLEDRYLSRSPVRFKLLRGGLEISPPVSGSSLKIDGVPCNAEQWLDAERLASGVVLSLASRIVMLLHTASPEPPWPDDCGLVGEHPSLQLLRRQLCAVAARDTPVLLLGESGTGKELVARALHERSERRQRPLVAVNVAAIPEELAAAELFGVKRGAFTGAERDRQGYFGKADGGTLFLDEIGACSQAIQSQLLRALQQGEVQAPGGATERVDIRVLAATDADVDSQFSKALRYRLGGVELQLPPLRERRQDIGRLLRHFLPRELLESARENPAQVSRWVELMTRLALHGWPGNIRELANCAQQIDIASQPGDLVAPASLPELSDRSFASAGSARLPAPSDQQVRDALSAARWEVSRAARELQISRQALYRRMESIPGLRTAAEIPGAEITSIYRECDGDLDQAALRLEVSRAALMRRWRAMDLLPGGW